MPSCYARPVLRRVATTIALIAVGVVLAGSMSSCSWVSGLFGGGGPHTTSVSVFDLHVGDCFLAPTAVKAELSDLKEISCDKPHQQELYAVKKYPTPTGQSTADSTYPGGAVLDTYAKGACAEAFTGYVGVAYPDSGLWMTYLLPTARSWQQGDDRSVLCFVTTTGSTLTASVKGSKQ